MITRRRASEIADAQRLLDLLSALAGTAFRQLLWQQFSARDLTYAQFQMLAHVAEWPACPMNDVAKAFGVSLPAVTHIVDRLEQKKLLARGDDPADRRVYVLELTPAGRTLVRTLQATRLASMRAVLARMAVEDRRRVVTGLEALVDAASALADGAPQRRAKGRR